MILFGLSVLFVLSVSAFVAQEMRQDVSITFLILLIVFSGMTYKRRVNNELKILKSSMEVSFIYEPMKIGGITLQRFEDSPWYQSHQMDQTL